MTPEDAFSGLVARGLPPHVAEGIVLNLQDESGLNPGINEQSPIVAGSRGGYGLAQWTGPRRKALEAEASARGVAVDDPDFQLDFLVSELQGPESRALDSLMQTSTPGDAAAAFATNFLRPAKQHLDRRVADYTGGTMSGGFGSEGDSYRSGGGMPSGNALRTPRPPDLSRLLAQLEDQPQGFQPQPGMSGPDFGGAYLRGAQAFKGRFG